MKILYMPMFLALAFMTAAAASAQIWLQDLPKDKALSFPEVQNLFTQWAEGRDLQKERGWKWYKRNETFHMIRAAADGSMSGLAPYAATVRALDDRKQPKTMRLSSASWSPVGPTDLPPSQTQFPSGMGRVSCITFHPTDPDIFWVGHAQGGIWKTVNGGASWLPLGDNLPLMRISDIAVDPNNPETLYIALGDYSLIGANLLFGDQGRPTYFGLGVMKTIDGGATWQPTGLSFAQEFFDGSLLRRIFVHPDNSQRLVAAGFTGVWLSDDGGATWSNSDATPIWDIEAHPVNPNILYAGSAFIPIPPISGESGIRKSTDFGQTWETLPSGIPPFGEILRIELAISASAPENIYAVVGGTDQGFYGVYRSADDGASWNLQAFRDSGPNILGFFDGSEAGGQNSYDLTILVHPENPETAYIGGINLWGSTDGGQTWDGVSNSLTPAGGKLHLHSDQQFSAYNPLSQKYYICNDGGLYVTDEIKIGSWQDFHATTDYQWPTDWEYLSSGMAVTEFYRFGLSKNNPVRIIAGSQDNSTMYFDGNEWVNTFFGDGMECFLHPDNPEILYASTQFGGLYKSLDGGRTSLFRLGQNIDDIGAWTTPFMMHPTQPDILYAAYSNLWRSLDAGDSWERLSNFDPIPETPHSPVAAAMAIPASDPDRIYVVKHRIATLDQPSLAHMTSDGGDTWHNITAGLPDSLSLTDIAVDHRAPQTAWITCSAFYDGIKVFKTTDAGAQWQNISRNLPNLPVNCILHDTNSARNTLYVGTDVGVYYTNDDLDEWLPYNDNLPNVLITELELHEPTRMLYAATYGRGVWMSEPADAPVSVADQMPRSALSAAVQPNPNNGIFTLKIDDLLPGETLECTLVNITGRVVHRETLHAGGTSLRSDFHLDLPYGAYYLRINRGASSQAVRFVIQE